MQRNTLILRLVVLVGTLVVAAVFVGGLMATRVEGPAEAEAQLLSPERMQEYLAERGHEVVSLQREGGLYQAKLANGELLWIDASSGKEIALPARRGNALQTSELLRLLRHAGYQDITTPQWRRGAFEAEARDEVGTRWRLRLDTYSGEVLEREAL